MENTTIREGKLVVKQADDLDDKIEARIKQRFGQGVFIQESFEAPDNRIAIKLGVSYPKDVSDRRAGDRVTKYINIDDVSTLYADPTGNGYYNVELPEKSELKEDFHERRSMIIDQLDWSMAKNIFSDVYQLDPVKNQLSSLAQIVRWLRESAEIEIERLDDIQRTDNTREYLEVLRDLGYVQLTDEDTVRVGRKLEIAEDQAAEDGLSMEKYQQAVIGNIVADGYHILRDQLDLRMLNHFPKFANSYYYSAVQRNKSDLWLTKKDLQQNLRQEWNDDVDEFILDDKLRKLEKVDVIQQENGLVSGDPDIYRGVTQDQNVAGLAD
ncbi:hypothetical protein R3751_16085 [Halorubrum distributum]|uniref:hypothetical protein n=1 Tax=Halorubrum distributum TaxID=29283 RepID=UPI002953D75F|nr:hypothetical protein [Halorubrum distributum]MDV7351285.1 hypothetical protein [Halorubrum distributum]